MEPDPARAKKLPGCPRCGNRLRLRADQVGTQVSCPKCKCTFTVGRAGDDPVPSVPPPKVADDAYEPEVPLAPSITAQDDAYEPEVPLIRSFIVPDEEVVDPMPPEGGDSHYNADWSVSDDLEAEPPHARVTSLAPDYLAVAKAKGLLRDTRVIDPPKWTYFSGVFTFPWQGVNRTRWAAMSFGLCVTGVLAWQTADDLGLFSRVSGVALMGLFLGIVTIALALATFSLCAASLLACIQDTADGHAEPQESSMPEWNQWLFTLLSLTSLWAASAAIGFPLSLIEPIGPAACFVSSMVVFPILLLSAMEADSFFLPYSPNVLGTLVRYWYGWLMFYLLTTLMFAAWVAAFDAGIRESPYLAMLLSGPVVAAMILIYARLLGRLAWRASGAPLVVVDSQDGDQGPSPRRGKRKKRRRGMRIEFPQELEGLSRGNPDDPIPPPQISSSGFF